jgi:prealbumin domain-containing protein
MFRRAFRTPPSHDRRWLKRLGPVGLALALVVAPLTLLPSVASATLASSPYNGADGLPDTHASVTTADDGVGTGDLNNYSGGKEDDLCPPVVPGSSASKADFDLTYSGTTTNSSGVFLYLAWHRGDGDGGTTSMDFELNQSTAVACNGLNSVRTEGDLLISYDFHGNDTVPTITVLTWDGIDNWIEQTVPQKALLAANSEASGEGSFGELAINLTGAGIFNPLVCQNLATVFAKSRASNPIQSDLKDVTEPVGLSASNCGSIDIHKVDDAQPPAPLAGAVFTLYTDGGDRPGSAVVPAQSCTTKASGNCSIVNIFPGTYWIVETTIPAGHTGAAPREIVVGLVANTPANPVTFVDNRLPATVNIVKQDDTGAVLAGATFALYTDGAGGLVRGPAVSPAKSCTTDLAGLCTISGILPAGTYWLHETVVPAGYTTAADQKVTLALNQTVTLTFVDNRLPVHVGIHKVDDANGPVAGAVFGLFTEADDGPGQPAGGTPPNTATCTTNAAGDCTMSAVVSAGRYWIVETSTPAGYFTAPAQRVDLVPGQAVGGETGIVFIDVRKPIGITLDKKVNGGDHASAADALRAHGSDPLTYTVVISNNGQVPLTITGMSDSLYPGLMSACPQAIGSVLAAGASFTCSYTVSASGDAHNVAAVSAVDGLDRSVTASDGTYLDVIHPAISIRKTVDPTSVSISGPVTYTYVITNTGDTVLHGIVISDDIIGAIGTIASLAPGASTTLTKTVVVDAKTSPTNIGTVMGTDVLGKTVKTTDKATITVVLGVELVKPTVAPATAAPVGLPLTELPRTGGPLQAQTRAALALIEVGLVLAIAGRRRRTIRRAD